MRNIKLRILNQKKHEQYVREFDYEVKEESNLYVLFTNITEIQKAQLDYSIESGVYRLCGDEDYDFEEITTNDKHDYKNFEDYYNQHKAEYMNGSGSGDREFKRIHEGLHDIVHYMSKELKCNNITATTTMLLQFGVYELYNRVSKDDFDIINNSYFKSATSAIQHKEYFNGAMSKMILSQPAMAYANSRAVIFDVNRYDKKVTFYQTDYVFKTLETLNRIGFDGNRAKHGYELLLGLAMTRSDFVSNIGINQRFDKLTSPTIEVIQEVIEELKKQP